MMRTRFALLASFVLATGCSSSSEMVPLLTAAGVPITDTTNVPLRVVTRSTAVQDPLPVRGSGVSYADVEIGLGNAIASATAPWAAAHRKAKGSKEGWELFVELTNAKAQYSGDRIIFELGIRATLRTRSGYDYLAQTQLSCRQGGVVAADKGAPVIYGCMMELGHDLSGWLDGVDLDAVGAPHSST